MSLSLPDSELLVLKLSIFSIKYRLHPWTIVCQERLCLLCLSGTLMLTLSVRNAHVDLVFQKTHDNFVFQECSCWLCLSGTLMFILSVRNARVDPVCQERLCLLCLSGTLSVRNAHANVICLEYSCQLCP
jgi:hypothetical protein